MGVYDVVGLRQLVCEKRLPKDSKCGELVDGMLWTRELPSVPISTLAEIKDVAHHLIEHDEPAIDSPPTLVGDIANPSSASAARSEPDVAELLRVIISNQERQLGALRAIRWAIVGFSIWFMIQYWLVPRVLLGR